MNGTDRVAASLHHAIISQSLTEAAGAIGRARDALDRAERHAHEAIARLGAQLPSDAPAGAAVDGSVSPAASPQAAGTADSEDAA